MMNEDAVTVEYITRFVGKQTGFEFPESYVMSHNL